MFRLLLVSIPAGVESELSYCSTQPCHLRLLCERPRVPQHLKEERIETSGKSFLTAKSSFRKCTSRYSRFTSKRPLFMLKLGTPKLTGGHGISGALAKFGLFANRERKGGKRSHTILEKEKGISAAARTWHFRFRCETHQHEQRGHVQQNDVPILHVRAPLRARYVSCTVCDKKRDESRVKTEGGCLMIHSEAKALLKNVLGASYSSVKVIELDQCATASESAGQKCDPATATALRVLTGMVTV
eukprot:3728950-Rhodomonas_salina.2